MDLDLDGDVRLVDEAGCLAYICGVEIEILAFEGVFFERLEDLDDGFSIFIFCNRGSSSSDDSAESAWVDVVRFLFVGGTKT